VYRYVEIPLPSIFQLPDFSFAPSGGPVSGSGVSACASGSLDPSHVLLATGLSAERAHGSVRISMGRDTTRSDIDYVLDKMPKVMKKIRNMSNQ